MQLSTVLCLIGGTVGMIAVMLICRDRKTPLWKGLVSSILLTVIGVLGVKLMYFIENGDFSGLSFFGAVFFIPVLAFPVAFCLRMNYLDYLDVSAPSVAVMLAVMKINCLYSGCCRGKVLGTTAAGAEIRFPSQIFEMVTALLIAAFLIWLIKKNGMQHKYYPYFMFLYGFTRFVLNLFRETDDFFWGFGIGNLWAVVSFVVGIVWMLLPVLLAKRNRKDPETDAEDTASPEEK